MAFLNLSQKNWAIVSSLLLIAFCSLGWWSFQKQDNLRTELTQEKMKTYGLTTLVNNYKNRLVITIRSEDSLKKENVILLAKLQLSQKNYKSIQQKYDKIRKQIDTTGDYNTQLSFTNQLLSEYNRLTQAQRR